MNKRDTMMIAFNGYVEDIVALKRVVRKETELNFSEAMRKIISRALKDKSWILD